MPETTEEQLRRQLKELSESAWDNTSFGVGLSVQDFTPYLLVKILERLESIEASLEGINSSMTDFWNSKYNS